MLTGKAPTTRARLWEAGYEKGDVIIAAADQNAAHVFQKKRGEPPLLRSCLYLFNISGWTSTPPYVQGPRATAGAGGTSSPSALLPPAKMEMRVFVIHQDDAIPTVGIQQISQRLNMYRSLIRIVNAAALPAKTSRSAQRKKRRHCAAPIMLMIEITSTLPHLPPDDIL
jgi:hypothetical protein